MAAPLSAVSVAIQASTIRQVRHTFSDLFDELETRTNEPQPIRPVPVAGNPLGSVASLPTIVVGVLFVIWFHRAATMAARLGRPARHTPGWAVGGWLIPIVNFFFPYQSARDLFRSDESSRHRVVVRWWASYLVASLLSVPLTIVAGFREGAAVSLACVALSFVAWMFAAVSAASLIDEVGASLGEDLRPRLHGS